MYLGLYKYILHICDKFRWESCGKRRQQQRRSKASLEYRQLRIQERPIPFFTLFRKPLKPHLTTLSHCRPEYSNKTEYNPLITIRYKFYCVHAIITYTKWKRERERKIVREKKRMRPIAKNGFCLYVYTILKRRKQTCRGQPVYGMIVSIPSS